MSPSPENLSLSLTFQTSSGRTYELDNPMDLSGGWVGAWVGVCMWVGGCMDGGVYVGGWSEVGGCVWPSQVLVGISVRVVAGTYVL